MVSIDDVVNTVVPIIIFIVFVAILYKPFKPMVDNLREAFGKLFGRFKKSDEQMIMTGIQYE